MTGIYTVLVEGDDPNEPVADAARSLLDGHIVLSRDLAQRGHFPPIDVPASISRVMPDVVSPGHLRLARLAREALATYRRVEDLIAIGAYREGSDPGVERARSLIGPLDAFLAQASEDAVSLPDSVRELAVALGETAAKETT